MSTTRSKTALYRLYSEDGRLLYVGISDQLGNRWEQHLRRKPWWPEVQRLTSEWHPDRASAALAEAMAIQKERPLYNIRQAKATAADVTVQDVEDLGQAVGELRRALAKFEEKLGLRPRRGRTPATVEEALPLPDETVDKMLVDLAKILDEAGPMRLSDLARLLRADHPEWMPYRKMTGQKIAQVLRSRGIRFTNTKNIPKLDPKDLPQRGN